MARGTLREVTRHNLKAVIAMKAGGGGRQVALPEEPDFYLWRMMIDQAHQGRGHGLAALRLLIEHVRTRPHDGELLTSIVEPAPQLLAFYGAAGFVPTERHIEGERVLRLALD